MGLQLSFFFNVKTKKIYDYILLLCYDLRQTEKLMVINFT